LEDYPNKISLYLKNKLHRQEMGIVWYFSLMILLEKLQNCKLKVTFF